MDRASSEPDKAAVEHFIRHWQGREGGQERANYQRFLLDVCELLRLPKPDPAGATHERNDYVFERVVRRQRDEGETIGRIDLYRRDCFVLEAKQSRLKGGHKEVWGRQNSLPRPLPRRAAAAAQAAPGTS